jgi:hypothetical protein
MGESFSRSALTSQLPRRPVDRQNFGVNHLLCVPADRNLELAWLDDEPQCVIVEAEVARLEMERNFALFPGLQVPEGLGSGENLGPYNQARNPAPGVELDTSSPASAPVFFTVTETFTPSPWLIEVADSRNTPYENCV